MGGPIVNNNIMIMISVLILFSALSIISNANVILDTDGDQLQNGGKYYIRPVGIISVNGGLTISSGSRSCPYYITPDKDETFPGIPVTISSPIKFPFINTGLPISIAFDRHMIDVCMQPLNWQVIADESTGKSYVRTGGIDWTSDFSILNGSRNEFYKIKYNFNQGEVGLFEKDGLLGINTGTPLNVVFVKAPGFNGIAMEV